MPEDTDKTTPRGGGGGRSASSPPEAPAEERYERDELVRAAKALLGSKPMYVAGALARGDSRKKTFTLAEAKALLEEHMTTPETPEEHTLPAEEATA